MDELVQLLVKTYGLLGILLLAPFIATVYVWNENKRLHGHHEATETTNNNTVTLMNDKIVKAQEQRVADAQAITNKLVEIVSEQSALNKETNLVLERIKDKLDS